MPSFTKLRVPAVWVVVSMVVLLSGCSATAPVGHDRAVERAELRGDSALIQYFL
jgi:hypothetical protein